MQPGWVLSTKILSWANIEVDILKTVDKQADRYTDKQKDRQIKQQNNYKTKNKNEDTWQL